MDRYARNRELISENDQAVLQNTAAAVIGLGGLGGHIAEQLARLGFGKLLLFDSDAVEQNNLNRQMFATEKSLGMSKCEAALNRLSKVNSSVEYVTHSVRITEENGLDLLKDADIMLDAVDNIATRYALESLSERIGIPLIHGSIGGWWGQVSTIFPGDRIISRIYPHKDAVGAEANWGNPAFTPAIVASIQVAEALKVCLSQKGILRKKLLRIDLLEHEYFIIDIS